MKRESFGEYVRRIREEKNLPLRKVAARLDCDTSTLSKIERGERLCSQSYLQPLSEILGVSLREIQVNYVFDTINRDLGSLEFISDGLRLTVEEFEAKPLSSGQYCINERQA